MGYHVVMAPKSSKPKVTTRVRSAITGRFVKNSQAKRSPKTTVTERFKAGRRKS